MSAQKVMVSLDHFKQELAITLRQAHSAGALDLLVSSVEFASTMRWGSSNADHCCQAMNDELKLGDIIEYERNSIGRLTIRYQLPRAG